LSDIKALSRMAWSGKMTKDTNGNGQPEQPAVVGP
jgi:hypothetical protein